MLTPTRREVASTTAAKVPDGAQLWGGPYDGATVRRACRVRWGIVLLLEDGCEVTLNGTFAVSWLHPASRRAS